MSCSLIPSRGQHCAVNRFSASSWHHRQTSSPTRWGRSRLAKCPPPACAASRAARIGQPAGCCRERTYGSDTPPRRVCPSVPPPRRRMGSLRTTHQQYRCQTEINNNNNDNNRRRKRSISIQQRQRSIKWRNKNTFSKEQSKHGGKITQYHQQQAQQAIVKYVQFCVFPNRPSALAARSSDWSQSLQSRVS